MRQGVNLFESLSDYSKIFLQFFSNSLQQLYSGCGVVITTDDLSLIFFLSFICIILSFQKLFYIFLLNFFDIIGVYNTKTLTVFSENILSYSSELLEKYIGTIDSTISEFFYFETSFNMDFENKSFNIRNNQLKVAEFEKEIYLQSKNLFTVDGFSDYSFCDDIFSWYEESLD